MPTTPGGEMWRFVPSVPEPTYLTTAELAARWNYSKGTLRNWRSVGKGPPFVKIAGKALYPLAEIERLEDVHATVAANA